MTTRLRTKFFALALGSGLSLVWLSAVVVGMQRPTAPVLHSIELPTVVVVARKATESSTTAQVKPVTAKNS
ncbi:MAG: hypothetical protein IPG23_04380 [Burkholderiales bacterium]|mgnify:CR=1 FL=1|jgi:hypothetical protein|nr:hypothetical protein [Burkholderiales bacterium]